MASQSVTIHINPRNDTAAAVIEAGVVNDCTDLELLPGH